VDKLTKRNVISPLADLIFKKAKFTA